MFWVRMIGKTKSATLGLASLASFLSLIDFEVTTRREDSKTKAIFFEVTGLDDPITFQDSDEELFGTRVRVYLRMGISFDLQDIPKIVSSYARHVEGINIVDVDQGTTKVLEDTWTLESDQCVSELTGHFGIRSSRFSFSAALREHAGTLSSDITICKQWFLG